MVSIIRHEWVFSRRKGDDNLVKRLLGSLSGVMTQVSGGFMTCRRSTKEQRKVDYRQISRIHGEFILRCHEHEELHSVEALLEVLGNESHLTCFFL